MREPSRTVTALVTFELLLLGWLFLRVLVANQGDNAYLDLGMIGLFLLLASGFFTLATLAPARRLRRVVLVVATGLLGVVALISVVLLVQALVIIPSQDYRYDPRVFGRHLIGLLVLVPALLGATLLLFHPHRNRAFTLRGLWRLLKSSE